MYELSRVRLHSAGPSAARYQDVVLDFSGVGRPVRFQEDTLIGPADVWRRPSPASVLFLENGGGKSVLIKLIFSVMLPGRRQVVGTSSTRVLENFVLADDVAHVVLEWMHTETGRLLLTGKVSEWRNQTVSGDPENLADLWYCLRPSEAVGLETLPLVEQDRMVSQAGYRKRLAEAAADDPGLEFYATRERGEWTSRLGFLGLDAELFRYQREMNAGEGEAAGAFTFTSDEAFVDFLLRAVIAEDDPREIAELVGQYTKSLAERDSLMVEREFVEQALERLQPLHDAHTAHELAVKAAATAGTAYTELAHGLSARSRVEHQRHAICITTAKTAADRNKAAEDNAQLRRAAALELERLVGQFRLRAAEASKKDADRESRAAELDANAWRETDTVAELRLATSAADEVARIIQAAEESTRPTLERKNEAAAALAGGLLAFAKRAAAEADDAAGKVEQCTGRAETADNERVQHERDSAKAQAQADAAAARITDIDVRIAAAVTFGLIPAGLDAVTAAEQAVTLTNEYREQLSVAENEGADLDEELDEARQHRNRAESDAKRADGELRAGRELLATATARTDDLTMRSRLAELLDTDAIILATDADTLADALAGSIRDLETLRARLQAEAAAGEHVRAALESGGLLPPPPEVTIACEALNTGGIVSWTGWDYLAQVEDVDRRRQMLEAAPHLATGIVLNDPEQLAEAAELLTARELFPAYFLAVGPSDALLTVGPPPFGLVVPPNPALYDPDAAATARAALRQRDEERRHQLGTVADAHRGDVELLRELNAWRTDFPPGRMAEIEQRCVELAHQAVAAESDFILAENELTAVTARRATVRASLPELRSRLKSAEARERDLRDLAKRARMRPGLEDEERQAKADAETHRGRAGEAVKRARVARSEAADHQRRADSLSRSATDARDEIADVLGGGDVETTESPPEEPIELLRRRLRVATEAYERAEVGLDLRTRLERAERDQAQARSRLEKLEADVRRRAEELLDTVEAADPGGRALARQRATGRLREAREQATAAAERFASGRTTLDSLTRQRQLPTDFLTPVDEDDALAKLRTARTTATLADRDAEDSRNDLRAATTKSAAAERTAQGFADFAGLLGVKDTDPDAAPFSGDLDAARQRHTRLQDELKAADRHAAEMLQRVTAATDELRKHATAPRYTTMQSTVRQQIASLPAATLSRHAAEWVSALRPRLRSLSEEIAGIDRHRNMINVRLQGMVNTALRTLRNAQRLSRLPQGLDDWTGQEFLRISFQPLEEAALVEAMGVVIDEAAHRRTTDGRELKLDGISLLLRAVHRAVPRGFRVDILKPDSVLRNERQRVSEIKDVFSGGQQLTAAIILYCTMAALRANNRGRASHRHSGVLFLDNPIGRASAGYLLELQRSVATALGVQLVYTTGLFDAGALSAFPLIIRLRNDADLRTGRKYLAVDDVLRPSLDALGDDDAGGNLSAIRTFVHEDGLDGSFPAG